MFKALLKYGWKEKEFTPEQMRELRKRLEKATEEYFKEFAEVGRRVYHNARYIVLD